jgi:threonine synthase|tara:strand:+ start:2820 stop:3959 length:1140 start_codon:yes stop_codon:yes gene_type:complete
MTTVVEAKYIAPKTNTFYPIDVPRWCSEDGSPLMITDLPGISRDEIDTSALSIWRYAAALPIAINEPITLQEGCTPCIEGGWEGSEVHFKLEWFAPTGSFKDRGVSVMLSTLRQQGIKQILEDSSGNGGASVAAYAAAGGMTSKILVPAYTQAGKTVQMRAYGADVELVPGVRQDTADEAIRQAKDIFYASHNWQAFFLQGTKTLAYELWEDFNFCAPDNIIIPTGAGSNILGCDIGFSELLRRGEITKLPRLFAVQPQNCSPLHSNFQDGLSDFSPVETQTTIAEGTAIAQPIRTREVLTAIRRSKGQTIAVTEQEILEAFTKLARMGLYVEPTSAGAAAALSKLRAQVIIKAEETTVVLLTGTGLKSTHVIGEFLGI